MSTTSTVSDTVADAVVATTEAVSATAGVKHLSLCPNVALVNSTLFALVNSLSLDTEDGFVQLCSPDGKNGYAHYLKSRLMSKIDDVQPGKVLIHVWTTPRDSATFDISRPDYYVTDGDEECAQELQQEKGNECFFTGVSVFEQAGLAPCYETE